MALEREVCKRVGDNQRVLGRKGREKGEKKDIGLKASKKISAGNSNGETVKTTGERKLGCTERRKVGYQSSNERRGRSKHHQKGATGKECEQFPKSGQKKKISGLQELHEHNEAKILSRQDGPNRKPDTGDTKMKTHH